MEESREEERNLEIYYQRVLLNLEQAIRNNRFNSKEELNRYIIGLKSNGIPEAVLSNEKVLALLNLYDELNQVATTELDMQNYKEASLADQNMIISKKTDTVLKTDTADGELAKEFLQTQNELTARTNDGLANADMVFNQMRDTQKEELSLIPLTEAVERANIDSEVLNKIRFFVTNSHINPYSYQVDPESGVFYNTETQELLEVRKNEQTGAYEIYRSGEIEYQNTEQSNENSQNQLSASESKEAENEIVKDTDEETLVYKNKNVKVRKLIKPVDFNNAAFVKNTFIIISIFASSILFALALLIMRH